MEDQKNSLDVCNIKSVIPNSSLIFYLKYHGTSHIDCTYDIYLNPSNAILFIILFTLILLIAL